MSSGVLVTGGNRGIGLAICKGILQKSPEHKVYLGSRSLSRGKEAVAKLKSECGDSIDVDNRVQVVPLDVTSKESVKAAVELVKDDLGNDETKGLYGLVNNAGGMTDDMQETLDMNVFGLKSVTESFLPLLKRQPNSRIVNMASASGPNFVSRLPRKDQKWLMSEDVEWKTCADYMKRQLDSGRDEMWFNYGLSKAIVNSYTRILARENPDIVVHSCSPGYIYTELTHSHVPPGVTPESYGMKRPEDGAVCPLYLLFDDQVVPRSRGWYFGSDCLRSPIHEYRSPGDPPYTGP